MHGLLPHVRPVVHFNSNFLGFQTFNNSLNILSDHLILLSFEVISSFMYVCMYVCMFVCMSILYGCDKVFE